MKEVEETKQLTLKEWLHRHLTVEQYGDMKLVSPEYFGCSSSTIQNDLYHSRDVFVPLARKKLWVTFLLEKYKIKTSVAELFPEKLMEI